MKTSSLIYINLGQSLATFLLAVGLVIQSIYRSFGAQELSNHDPAANIIPDVVDLMKNLVDEPFVEDTIDGRKTETTATRIGNCLKLDQRGGRGEKDSVMTRDLIGDSFTMKMIVDNITCTRIYKRIQE